MPHLRAVLIAAVLSLAPVLAAAQTVDAPATAAPAPTDTLPRMDRPAASAAAPAAAGPTATPAAPAPDPVLGDGSEAPGAPMATATLPHDLSPFGMFMAADWVVKSVMVGLVLASVLTWTVGLVKALELMAAKRRLARAAARLGRAGTLADALEAGGFDGSPASRFVRAAAAEVRASEDTSNAGLKERVASRLDRIQAGAGRRMMGGTGILATIGSTAPFVGLFGTVWGIMNAFVGISKAQTTNLAVVAPGIAEALLATAIGLVAAIPAVVIYNAFARAIAGYRAGLADAAAEVQRLVSRDLDRQPLRRVRAAE
ncbi:tonB-system energizer ExbB [Mongoliimonas terrestris]|uniref:tonB-system energizer ExbB n=1 Tax=Mongoliimonas terrestris TaxID=1709001 RepID=UPI000949AA0E|nr:tonB-system energizer ExbB [Mongoliimonas terrestris]